MRSRDRAHTTRGRHARAAPREVALQRGRQLGGILGITCAGVHGFARGRTRKRSLGFLFAAEEILVFQKPRLAERIDQVLLQPADVQIHCQANQVLAQIARAVRAV